MDIKLNSIVVKLKPLSRIKIQPNHSGYPLYIMKTQFRTALLSLLVSMPLFVHANDSLLQAALESNIRSDDEKARDISRKPSPTLNFFEVKHDSKVLELVPGSGWYTKILGNYLRDNGELFLAVGAKPERLKLKENKLEHVKIIGTDFETTASEKHPGIRDVTGSDFSEAGFDIVLTFRNMHNFTEQGRSVINKAAFNALKPGGIYGVIDHTKRHMESYDDERWRRVDPVQIILELVSMGFEFEGYSNIHSRPEDELIYDSTDESINRNSDRFTLKFRKPL